MSKEQDSDLREELGARAADALAGLPPSDVAHLLEVIREARERERRELRQAAEGSLGIVPRFARGAVKKIVFGG